jgi:hypothetical protein
MSSPLASIMQNSFERLSAIFIAFLSSLYEVNKQSIELVESVQSMST